MKVRLPIPKCLRRSRRSWTSGITSTRLARSSNARVQRRRRFANLRIKGLLACIGGKAVPPCHDRETSEGAGGGRRLFLAQLSNLLAGDISIVHGVTGSSRTFMGEEGAPQPQRLVRLRSSFAVCCEYTRGEARWK